MSKRAMALAQFVEQVVSQFVAWFGGSIPSYSMSKCPQVQDAETEVAPSLECVAGWWRLVVKLALSAQ